MRIYWIKAQAPRRVLALAKHLGVNAECVEMDLITGGLTTPGYVALNPNKKVPTLVDGERVLWESSAIMAYLCIKQGSDMWPTRDPDEQVEVLRWISWNDCHWAPAVAPFYFEHIVKSTFGIGSPDVQSLKPKVANLRKFAEVLEGPFEWARAGRVWKIDNRRLSACFDGHRLAWGGDAVLRLSEHFALARWSCAHPGLGQSLACCSRFQLRGKTMKSHYRWVIVAAGGFMGCVAIGSIFSLPVFLQPMMDDTGWSRASISLAMTLDFITMGVASFAWGVAMDRYGPRVVSLAGSILLGLGLVLASRASSVLEFQLLYGIVVGAGGGAIFAPNMATVTGWFDRQRSLAVSLVSAGMGMAPMTVAPIAARLVSAHDWRFAQLSIGIAAWALLLPTALLIRRSPALAQSSGSRAALPQVSARDALRSPQFAILALTYFFSCATHSGPLFHTVSYAMTCGLSVTAAVSIYSVEGASGLFGRVVFGLLGDRFGAKRVFAVGLLVQALAAGSYMFARQRPEFYIVAAVFGFVYAGVMPLYAVLMRENFPLPIMGTMVGAGSMASSLGMALGPLAGGLIFDRSGSYAWLYISSFGIGLGAAAICSASDPHASLH